MTQVKTKFDAKSKHKQSQLNLPNSYYRILISRIRFDFWQCLNKYMGFRATLNFRKFKVALNPMYRIVLNFAKSCILFCLSVCVCPQSPYRGNDTILWIFPIVPCHAFCMWHWPIGKDLDLSFIWGHHHLHIVGLWISVKQLHTSQLATPAEETQQGRNVTAVHGCNLAFSLDSIVSLPR